MAVLDREKPFDHAHGLVQDHEPFFFQNGCAFTHGGVEVFKDSMGNFSILATSDEGITYLAEKDAQTLLAAQEAEAAVSVEKTPVKGKKVAETAQAEDPTDVI